ncbi:MAG: hypothetical protein M1823_002648 [Watsoniomyces obsoletus]|nr:MAG: hypothetical protein M1823_002648 [Watsoniomyces obsoletus]
MDPAPNSPMLVDPEEFDEKHDVAIIGPQQLETDDVEPEAEAELEAEPRADDYEGMKPRVLRDFPDLEIEAEAVSTWQIENWRSLPKKVHGPVFECGGHPWRILFFPYGNNVEFASLYLEQAHEEKPKNDWYACAQFALVMWNPNDPTVYTFIAANHRFAADEGDWGFTRFAELRKLFAPRWEGKSRPLVENHAVNITAYMRIFKDPTGVLWHNFINYDSKKETGYVGLRNQGATCYLNSLLQSLYFTNAFRKAVYQVPTQNEPSLSNSAYTLQRLFYLIQTSTEAVPTTELTRSFGWDSKQIFEQQDVQELCRILMERLEAKMKGTEAENALAKLFVGKMKTYISCINVDFESSRIEDFWDIQLTVSGKKNLEESFREYIQVETMDGDNKYFAEGHGLQDAKKGVIFESFPQVLHLQLKRFEYDVRRDATMKVNDRYEFPEIFDASPYLSEDADQSEPYVYQLHGVLVHSGDFNAGHYYAFLKPAKDGPFYKFDDDRVTRATMKEVLEENYGGDYDMANGAAGVRNPYTRILSTKRSMSAYMLVYVRQSRLDDVLVDVSHLDIPPHLQKKLEEERALREQRRKDREEQHLYLTVGVVTDETFKNYQGLDLASFDADPDFDPAAPRVYRVLRTSTVGDFVAEVAHHLGRQADHVRLWVIVNRQNKTSRPDQILRDPGMTIEEAYNQHGTINGGCRFWAEVAENVDEEGKPSWPDVQAPGADNPLILIFLKHFDATNQTLKGVGHVYIPRRARVADLVPKVNKIVGWPEDTAIELYEEIKPGMIEPLKQNQILYQAEIQDGDVVCFQKSLSTEEATTISQTGGDINARQFYDYLCNKVTVHFVPRSPSKRDDGSFDLDLSRRMMYDQVAAKVGEHLKVDPTHIRFWSVNPHTGNPKSIIRRTPPMNLHQILTSQSIRPAVALFYEVHDLSLDELDTMKLLKVTWLSEGISKDETFELLVPKNGCVGDALALLEKKANLPEGSAENMGMYEVHNCRIFKTLQTKFPVSSISEYCTLYAEMIPEEELEAPAKSKFIDAFHFNRETPRFHGIPFRFVILPGEIFKDTKARLQKRTGIPEKQIEKIKFALVPRAVYSPKPMYLNDDDVVHDLLNDENHLLGLDHVPRSKGAASGRGDGIIIR